MSLFARLSAVSRKRKLELFHETMRPAPSMRVLDLGAEIESAGDDCCKFMDQYPWKRMITAANIDPRHVEKIARRYPEVEAVVADARSLPWPDKHFDIVYSNAVIEHVGTFEDQKRMASEVMRVGKRWFITTPNRWYPFEFHLRLPFVTWLPGDAYLRCGRIIRYNHVRKRYVTGADCSGIRLMTAGELMRCFSGGRVIKQRVTFMAETLIAVGELEAGKDSPACAEQTESQGRPASPSEPARSGPD
ncbi:MAG: class I SAM-dependent methyltransferase [Planctomycetaceae bacterium]|nr:MAG: class I SAM-dependent methyltransferase [Planctomycetaceae bacterium]